MANDCMWCADGKLVEVDHGKWRCDKCHAMHDQVVDKGGPGGQETEGEAVGAVQRFREEA